MDLRYLPPDSLPVRVGGYELLALLGEGGTARVFRARRIDEPGAEHVALKVMNAAPERRRAAEQLAHEARVGSLLAHRNLIAIRASGAFPPSPHAPRGAPFVAMELIPGPSLKELVAAAPLPVGAACSVAAQAAAGLHHAHTVADGGRPLRLVHRDVKPSNILLDQAGRALLSDFGLAKYEGGDLPATAPGMVKGSAAYLSPEQLAGEQATPRSDLFALGSTLWFALTGETLFAAPRTLDVLRRIARADQELAAAGVFERARALSPGLDGVLRRLLAGRPDERFADAADAADALEAWGLDGRELLVQRIGEWTVRRRRGAQVPVK